MSTVRLTQLRSRNGSDQRQLDTLRSLKLGRVNAVAEHTDSPQLQGMIKVIEHLVKVERA